MADDQAYQSLSIRYSGGDYQDEKIEYRLLSPAKLEAGKKYPLVLFLHGAGERGTDNRLQLKYLPGLMGDADHREQLPCFLLAPQCRPEKQWVDVPWGDAKSTPMFEQPSDQIKAALKMLERTIEENPVDPSRIYLTGLSMGGYGAWDLACRMPERFAGALIVCGGGDEREADKLKKLPIWVFHGDADGAVPVTRSREMVAAIEAAGGMVRYSELPGVGHNSWNAAYADEAGAVAWLFQQRRPE